jgi:GxxExxY protein
MKPLGLNQMKKMNLETQITKFSQILTEEILHKEESHSIIGLCMEVHSVLGKGHNEIEYGDALEYEFRKNGIPYQREVKINIPYKEFILPHYYYIDFIVFGKIILELKAIAEIGNSETKQVLNYLASAKKQVGLLVNFGSDSLKFKRIVL